MFHFNEHSLEMAIMELFTQQGYSYQSGETFHQELSEEPQWTVPVLKPYNEFGDDTISMAAEPKPMIRLSCFLYLTALSAFLNFASG